MAAIFKRKRSKFWYVKYYVHGQQVYRSLETTSERVARKLKEQIEADETRGEGGHDGPIRGLPDGRGGHPSEAVPGHP